MKESQINLLEKLAQYKYLTTSQMHRLGILKHKQGIYQILRELKTRSKSPIDFKNFGLAPGVGKLESFYFLTKPGVNFLIEDLGFENEIKAPIGNGSLFARDYFHRKYTIDFHIAFNQFLEEINGEIKFLDYYFDKIGNNRTKGNLRAKNKIDLNAEGSYIIPDIVTQFKARESDFLFLFEQHNGKDTKKLIKQLYNHLLVLEQGSASTKYNFEKNNRVVVIFEFESIKKATMKRLSELETFKPFNKFFIFKTNEELENNDFLNGWSLINGEKTTFI